MSASKCARCEQTVYPVEGLNCLDKIWHKGCFKCHECNMTLNMKNYKGYDKKPYCNAHCPQAKATTVADTPEIRRLAENTRIQSQAKYHEDFEKSKGKGFTAIADDPETVRIKNTSKIISNVTYHGELERKKQMEERRSLSGPEDAAQINNNNFSMQQNRMRDHSVGPRSHENDMPPNQMSNIHNQQTPTRQQQQQQQHLLLQQQQQHQQQLKLQKQQQHHIPAQGHQQVMMNRHSQHMDLRQQPASQQQQMSKQQPIPQQFVQVHPNQQQQQHIIMRQQQQHMMQRHSMDPSLSMNHQISKQSLLNNHNPNQQQQQQHLIKQQMMQNQSQYLQMNDALRHQQPANMGGLPLPQMMNPSHLGGQRVAQNAPTNMMRGPMPHHLVYGNAPQMGPMMNGAPMPKQAQQQHQQFVYNNQANRQMPIHPSQMQQINQQPHQMQQPNQMPRRVFRAMYDYVANDVDEVSFFENDILLDCVNVDGNWLIGKVARSGQTGMLPANYVAEISG